jgi:uncharacterized protein
MTIQSRPTQKIIVFIVLTFAFSAIFWALMISAGSYQAQNGVYLLGLMWCPGLSALITQLVFERSLRNMGWRPGKARYQWLGYLLPVFYGLVVYAIVWLTGLGGFSLEQFAKTGAAVAGIQVGSPFLFAAVYLLILIVAGTISGLVTALGEEIGWRGMLVPQLAQVTTFTGTAIISGGIWVAWHTPILLFAGYNAGAPQGYALVCFTVMVLGLSFVFAWLRLKSGSIWPAVLLHASHNLFIKNIFTAFTTNTGVTNYVIDEFGIAMALAAVALAFIYWRKRTELADARLPGSTAAAGG